jgi:hypothetical protein
MAALALCRRPETRTIFRVPAYTVSMDTLQLVAVTAREALAECERAAAELESPPEAWRRRWVAIVTLLGTVIDVLKRVDAERGDAALRQAVSDRWDEVKRREPARGAPRPRDIYWGFIDYERTQTVHLFTINAAREAPIRRRVPQVTVIARPGTGGRVFGPIVRKYLTSAMTGGPYKNRKPIDLVAEAITWLRTYLDDVDREAAKARESRGR